LKNGASKISGLFEMMYLSVSTALGFGDMTPATDLGRIVVGVELILGFIIFALLTSMIFRRISA